MSGLVWVIVGCWAFCGVLGWFLIEMWPDPSKPIWLHWPDAWTWLFWLPFAMLVGPIALLVATEPLERSIEKAEAYEKRKRK